MSEVYPSLPARQARHLRVIRDEESPPYDAVDPPTAKRESFVMLPADVLLDTDLPDRALRLYLILLYHRNQKSGQCNPSRKLLGKELGCDVETVTRMCAELERAGLVERTMPRPGGVTHYVLPLRKFAEGGPQGCGGGLHEDAEAPSANLRSRTIRTEQDEMNQQQGPVAANGFRPTWAASIQEQYPKVRTKYLSLSPQFTEGMFRSLLVDAERETGAVQAGTLLECLHITYAALADVIKSGKSIGFMKPYAKRILVDKIREATT